jgi:hypothetical protein
MKGFRIQKKPKKRLQTSAKNNMKFLNYTSGGVRIEIFWKRKLQFIPSHYDLIVNSLALISESELLLD